MTRFASVFSRVSAIGVAVLLGVACVCTAPAQDSGLRIRLLEEKVIQASPGGLPAVSYSVRDTGGVAGAVRLALPESGGHVLALTETGKVWAWGDNHRGQLGVGDTSVHAGWVAVTELDSVVAVAAGAVHSVALRQDGSVWTWGANEYGQSGDGSLWARSRPERVQGIRDVVAIAAGALYTLALRRDGTVWAWGSNGAGVAPVRGLERVAAIWVRGNRPYAFDAEGRQWTWGAPEAGLRQVKLPLELETGWPGLMGRDRSVRVIDNALEVEEKSEVVARIGLRGSPVDLQAGWAVGWIEESAQGAAGYALASEAAGISGQQATEGALALTASTTTLGSGPNPAIFGATVTLTATVSPSAATGKVTFYDGTAVLGVGTLAGGTATLATSLLPAGSRSLRAYYGGDASYLASTSASVAHSVNAQAANSFLATVNIAAGATPQSVAVGDFNADGKADLAVANASSNNVSILLGNGNGTFQPAVNHGTGTTPTSVAVGDFNGDGKADMAAANWASGSVSVLLGNGNGTFQLAVNYATGTSPSSVAVGDFNGDGKADLAVANSGSDNLSVLLGNGNGTFQAAVNYGSGSYPYLVAVGDFNSDGKADLAVANVNGGVRVLLGSGNGTFQPAVNYGAGTSPHWVAVGDFNGDGQADLAIANQSSNNVSVLLGNGNGTFQSAVNYSAGTFPQSVAVGDFNGDGKIDLVVTNYTSGSVSVLLGNGGGTFQSAVSYTAGAGAFSVAVGDFNGDGKADLAVANINSSNVSVLLATWVPVSTTTTLGAAPSPSALGQSVTLTATVASSAATGKVTFYDGTTVLGVRTLAGGTATLTTISLPAGSRSLRAYYAGDASYLASTSASVGLMVNAQPANALLTAVNYGVSGGPESVAVGDLNGDGKADLAVANASSGNVSILLGYGNGTFQSAANYAAGSSPSSLGFGDFNGDGKTDLAVANWGNNNVSVLLGNGDGTFQTPTNSPTGISPSALVVGDFNGDGKADLAITSASSGNVSVLLGNGNGTFQPAVSYAVGLVPLSLALGDFNGDGKADLVATNSESNSVSVLLGIGNGTFQAAVNSGVGTYPISVAVGDFNGDGQADLAVANSNSYNVSVLLGNGNGTFQPPGGHALGFLPRWIAVGDFNGDGKADLVLANWNSNEVAVLLGNGNGTFQTAVNYGTGTQPYAVVAGDFNGDGRTDLAVSNFGSNNVSVLLGTWVSLPTTTALTATPNPSTFGQSVTLTATVSPSAATGKVTFYDGTTVLGVGSLAGGTATLNTISLPTGSRSLRAYYAGDASYQASTSASVGLTVDAQPANNFLAAVNFGTGTSPWSVAAGDFNKDGKADLAVTNVNTSDVSVKLGNGDGTFQAAVNYATGSNPESVAIGDFNGDGVADLVVANALGDSVSVLLGNGNGSFQAAMNYGAGAFPAFVAVGDFNGDGKADLAVADYHGGNVSVLLGNGNGTFQMAVNYVLGGYPQSVAVGDFNGDGKADLAVADLSIPGKVHVLLGNGNGTFQAAVDYVVGANPWSVAVGDFNADGKADLAVANYSSNSVSVLLGNGNGTFQAAVNYGVGSEPLSVGTGDFDGDGKADLAVVNLSGNNVSVLLGNGNGTFQGAVNYGAGSLPRSLAVGDFNGDGKSDLAVANFNSNNVSILLGTWVPPVSATTTGLTATPNPTTFGQLVTLAATVSPSAATGKVTFYDGTTVLGVGTLASGTATFATSLLPAGSRSLRAYYGGDAGYLASTSAPVSQMVNAQPANSFLAAVNYGAIDWPSSVAAGDFNGDGRTDLAVASSSFTSNIVSVMLGNGDGTFQAAVNYGAGSRPDSVAVGDFNGDGKADLAVANYYSHNVSVLLGNGNGTFQAAVNYGVDSYPTSVAVGDFNGDGKADLAVTSFNSGNVSILLGNGNGTFQAALDFWAGLNPAWVAVGDFNGDGSADLAVANPTGNNVSVLLGNGNGTFQAAVNYGVGTEPHSVAVGDFNGDGKADLAAANYRSDSVSVLLGNGNGTFQAAVNYGAGSGPVSVTTGDSNGDGKADLVVANGDGVGVLIGDGNGSFQAVVNRGAGVGPCSVAIGDFNRDGRTDLAVANWESDNLSILMGTWVPPVVPPTPTTTALVAGPNPSMPGQLVTLTATVSASAATGQISFADGNTVLGVVTLTGGTATLATTLLPAGSRSLRAYYGGDAFYQASTSVWVTQTVSGSNTTATALLAAPNPSTVGQLVTLTATVTPAFATGQVSFLDGSTVLGVGTLAGGTATLTTSFLTVGSRSLRAYYGGDAVDLPSTSGWVTQRSNSSATGLHYVGSMAQLASGNYWKTTITLVNHGAAAATARLNFFNDAGGPLSLPITYASLAPAEAISLSSVERTIGAGASFSFSTTGPDDVGTVGWAQMLTDGDVSGFAVFRQNVHREQEAVVALETHNSGSYVLWFNNSGDFITGLAVANSSTNAALIPVIVRDEAGNQIGTQTLELPPLGHVSGALTSIINNTGGKVGSVEFRTPQGGQISVLGLRFNGISFTTIPVLDRSLQAPTAPLSSLIPAGSGAQLASGHYWQTTITLVNKGNSSARTKLEFFDNQGNPLALPVTFPATPGVPAAMMSTVERTLAPGASVSVSSTGPVDAETVGWARLSSDGDVGGFAIFRQDVDGAQEALVPMEIANPDAWLSWFDNTGTFASGVALVNNSVTPANVQAIVRDEAGVQINTQIVPLAGLGHISGALSSIIGNTAGKVGSVEFRTPAGGAITVLGLRFNGVSFTTIPVMPKALP